MSNPVKTCSVEGCERTDIEGWGLCAMHYLRKKRKGSVGSAQPSRRPQGGLCEFPGCLGAKKSKGYCSKHYARLLRHGDPSVDLKSKPNNICSQPECDKKVRAYGLCDTHRARVLRTGDVNCVRPNAEKGPKNPGWKGDEVSYSGAHRRVYRYRGSASSNTCQHCGSPAQHWAYDWTDPNHVTELTRYGLRTFSPDVSRYVPLCVPCHKNFDIGRDSNPKL